MKKCIIFMILITLMSSPVLAEAMVTVQINGEKLELNNSPEAIGGVIMLPAMELFSEFLTAAEWNENEKTLSVRSISDEKDFIVNDSQPKPLILNGILYIPLPLIEKALSAQIDYDSQKGILNIICNLSPQSIYFSINEYDDLGTWTINNDSTQGLSNNKTTAVPAAKNIRITADGNYRVWVRARDFASNNPGSRFFNVSVGGQLINHTFGQHGKEGFFWEDGGVVNLKKGSAIVEMLDTSRFYARFMGVFITPDTSFVPPEDEIEVRRLTDPSYLVNKVSFPKWAKGIKNTKKQYIIENENVKICFYDTVTREGKNIIQRQTWIKDASGWIAVDDRNDEFAYLLMISDNSKIASFEDDFYPKWQSEFEIRGNVRKYNSSNVFYSAHHEWLIPTRAELSDNKIKLFSSNEYADLVAEWELLEGLSEPLVTCSLNVKRDGSYSLGIFCGSEFTKVETESVCVPHRIQGMGLPNEGSLTIEMYATTPMSSITLKENNAITPGRKLTYGIVIEPDFIPDRFLYRDNNDSKFGLTVHGKYGGIQAGAFAPMLGSQEAVMEAGDSYEIRYRPTVGTDGWFENYKHVITDVFEIRDYRKNYISSLTDTIFNVRRLMMDDVHSGWDKDAKGHYNMEDRNMVNQGNPLLVFQDYMLTEDEDILERRVIPTMASLLTREPKSFFYGSGASNEAVNPIGAPSVDFGTTTFGGVYWMSRGLTPIFKNIGIDNGVKASAASIPVLSENIWYYKFTGNKVYLDKARKAADTYLANNVYTPRRLILNISSFVNSTYAPQLSPLLDMYEITGEKKYLDGAEASARLFLTTLWTAGIDNQKIDGETTITREQLNERKYFLTKEYDFWWYGNERWRLGFPKYEIGDTPDSKIKVETETVPSWVVSRVGLGIEQSSTFRFESLNIMMSNWAPDLVRLSKYTNDPIFKTQARNAVLGRGANYPGYYYNRKMVHQTHVDYPYTGPDYTSIYQHHIPVYLGILEDFLIAEAWSRSNGNINFPYIREHGYAYFWSRQFGFEAGSFFDEDDMWLWLDEDILEVDNIQINWLAAKKDGKLSFALMSEEYEAVEINVTLLEKAVFGSSLNTTAIVYDENGNKSSEEVINGKIKLTVPAKGFRGVTIEIDEIKAPAYSKIDFDIVKNSQKTEQFNKTVVNHPLGKAYALQMTLDSYFAYVYITEQPKNISKAVFNFSSDGRTWEKIESTKYPYEAIFKENDVSNEVEFYIETYDKNGRLLKKTEKRSLSSVMKK